MRIGIMVGGIEDDFRHDGNNPRAGWRVYVRLVELIEGREKQCLWCSLLCIF